MPLPIIQVNGYLPPGPHHGTPDEIEERFVAELQPSNRRGPIFQWWRAHRAALDTVVTVHEQWIGGSFLSSKPEPDDIDLCSLVDGPSYDAQEPAKQFMADSLLAREATKEAWHCHSFPIAVYPQGSPGYAQMVAAKAYWSGWWAKTRTDQHGVQTERGYVVTA